MRAPAVRTAAPRRAPWALPATLLAALLLLAGPVAAHVDLASSVPAQGDVLAQAPHSVAVTFTGAIEPEGQSLRVRDANGTRVDLGDLAVSGAERPTLRVSLPMDLPDGAYTVSWQVVSAEDGHPASGRIGFAVGDFAAPVPGTDGGGGVPWLEAAGRFLAFLGLAIALGAGLFLAWVPGSAQVPRRPVLEALLVGACVHAAGVAVLLKATIDATGLDGGDLGASGIGRTLLVRLGLGLGGLAFAAIAIAPRMPARAPPHVAVALLALAGLGSAWYGHAARAGLAGFVVDAMHLGAAAAWSGGLLVFLWLLGEARRTGWGADQVRLAGVRFGTAALACVVLLFAAGIGAQLAILGAPDPSDPFAAWRSPWGRVLAAKVGLTWLMIAIATVNRYGILEPARTGGFTGAVQRGVTRFAPSLRPLEPHAAGLRRLVRVEALVGVVVLALAGVLTSIPPPAQADAVPFEDFAAGGDVHGQLTLTPAPVAGGSSRLLVHIASHAGDPFTQDQCGAAAGCVTAAVAGGPVQPLTHRGGGDWSLAEVAWAQAGDAAVEVAVNGTQAQGLLRFHVHVAAA